MKIVTEQAPAHSRARRETASFLLHRRKKDEEKKVRIGIKLTALFLILACVELAPSVCKAQTARGAGADTLNVSAEAPAPNPQPPQARGSRVLPKLGIGVKVSLLGAGVEGAVPLGGKLNVRAGFNAISYNRTFTKDGITYTGNLSWRSGEANVDWFPFGHSFHLSPGLIFYDGNKATANAAVPGGQTFTLSGTTYQSNAANPVSGSGKIDFDKAAPSFRIGFGNLIPRSGRHWSILAEVGAAYQGSPHAALNLAGSACAPNGTNCVNAATDPGVQANVQAEQAKLNHDLRFFKFYPLISIGFGYSF